MDLRGRPCSKRHRLPCVPEGPLFFAAAFSAGERAPSETIERYAFLRVRRAYALVVGSRKSLLFNGFSCALVSRGENEAFGACARWSRCAVLRFLFIFVHRPFARSVFEIVGGAMFFACWKICQADRHRVSCHHRFLRSFDFQRFLKGGGGSCRRQGKSAAPSGRRGELGRCECELSGVCVSFS